MAKEDIYNKIYNIITEKVCTLETENIKLKQDLALATAKLEIYERIDCITGRDASIGFGPPIRNEGGND